MTLPQELLQVHLCLGALVPLSGLCSPRREVEGGLEQCVLPTRVS